MHIADITFVILTRNEEARIERALTSLPPGADAYILDAHSTDATIDIAVRHNARVELRIWTTFADARRYAIEHVSTPWLFMLDADEALSSRLCNALAELQISELVGYTCKRDNRFCGRVMRGGAWANEHVLRLVRTEHARIVADAAGDLHEHLAIDGPVGRLEGEIDHDSYPTLQSYLRKFTRYTQIEAEAQPASLLRFIASIPIALLRSARHYVVRRGYIDGWRGAFVAAASALYPIVVQYRALRYGNSRR